MDSLPLFHRIRGADCVLVGAGRVAARKLELLLAAGARLKVVAPACTAEFERLAAAERLVLVRRRFRAGDLDRAVLAVAATSDPAVNRAVSRAARARGIPVNVVDRPELCTVTFPAVVDRDPVCVAIGTGGSSPVLARLLRTRLEALLPARTGELARLAREFRALVRERLPDQAARRAFWEQILQGRVAELVYAGRPRAARRQLQAQLDGIANPPAAQGEVYLVGAGPGDPDLLTLRALRLMQQADVVLYDRLVSEPVLALVRRDAERIYVGKRAGRHELAQGDINARLVEYARAGRRVLRLKGGDPFIFGRGGEEIEQLAAAGIPFQVVPGITAAAGCASYAGIPLTHRDHAQAVRFQTGHRRGDRVDLDWEALARPGQTLVFYMPLEGLGIICAQLIGQGLPASLPAALIERGTRPEQRVFTGTLATLPDQVARAEVHAPTLLIVGEVVRLRDRLAWFEGRADTEAEEER
jgi:uroporphyrin-III C-methyltransferase / precorrin-2 dehydrogenase / sirohydrochlorin ferrochelatase